jgi:hypothetical protein
MMRACLSGMAIISLVVPMNEPDFIALYQSRSFAPFASTMLRLGYGEKRFEVAFAGDLKAKDLALTREWVDGFLAGLSAAGALQAPAQVTQQAHADFSNPRAVCPRCMGAL